MSYNKSIVPGILIKIKEGIEYFINYTKIDNSGRIDNYDNLEDCFYILSEIKTDYSDPDHGHDILVFYGLTEESFFYRSRWFIERCVGNGSIKIVA